jgi:hypothetical protein
MASKKLKQALMAGLAGAALAGSAKMKGEALKKGIGSDAVASGIKEKTGIFLESMTFLKKRVWKLINLCLVLMVWMVLKLVK